MKAHKSTNESTLFVLTRARTHLFSAIVGANTEMLTINEDAKFNSEEAENMTPRRHWGGPLTFTSNNSINTVS
jgi:hypothetical protein